jgi:iron complex outermembrane receptor protein
MVVFTFFSKARFRTVHSLLAVGVFIPCALAPAQSAYALPPTPQGSERIDSVDSALDEIIVTARKRAESDLDVPISVTLLGAASLARLNVHSFEDYATKIPNFSFSFGTSELGYTAVRSIAIRGITGEGTVGMYIDDMPVPESIDPRVVDIERIEVLRGPQGTLFGQGSLGGNLRIITRELTPSKADAYVEGQVGSTTGGSGVDYGFRFGGSENLIGDRLTGRLVGFIDHAAGFLTRTYPALNGVVRRVGNQGANQTYGGSVTMLWRPTDSLSATLRFMVQNSTSNGWIAPYAPLPRFEVSSAILNRAVDLQERSSDRWYLPSLVVNYRGDRFVVTSSSSYFNRKSVDREDASEGTNWYFRNILALSLPSSLPIPWDLQIPLWSTTNETRITFEPTQNVSGILGTYFSKGSSDQVDDGHDLPGIAESGLTSYPGYCPDALTCPSFGSNLNWYSSSVRNHVDRAVFGELYLTRRKLQLTLGLRAYYDSQDFNLLTMGAGSGYSVTTGSDSYRGIIPKVAIAYRVAEQSMIYASMANGFRQGVVTPPAPTTCGPLEQFGLTPGVAPRYKPDSVWSDEVGAKAEIADGRMLVKGAIFQEEWNNMRHRILLPVCYFSWRLNVGAARARGGEIEISGKPIPNVEVRAGVGFVDAKITDQGVPGLPIAGSRVDQIPRVTANVSGTLTTFVTQRVQGYVTLDLAYVGNSPSNTSGLEPPLIRRSYALVNGSLGVRWDAFDVSFYSYNIGNNRPNFGDLNPAGYVGHVDLAPDSPIIPRVATAQAFNAGILLRYRF